MRHHTLKNSFKLLALFTAVLPFAACQPMKNLSSTGLGNCVAGSTQTQSGAGIGVNGAGFGGAVAQSFEVPNLINSMTKVSLALSTNQPAGFSGPSGNLHLAIEDQANGFPSGNRLGEASISSSQITGTVSNYTFNFLNGVEISPNTTYWLVLTADYALNSNNFVIWAGESLNNGGTAAYYESFPGSPDSFWTMATKVGAVLQGQNPGGRQLAYSAGCQ